MPELKDVQLNTLCMWWIFSATSQRPCHQNIHLYRIIHHRNIYIYNIHIYIIYTYKPIGKNKRKFHQIAYLNFVLKYIVSSG